MSDDLEARTRELADKAWADGRYAVGASLDRAADAIADADRLARIAEAHRIAALAHMDQLQAMCRDWRPGQRCQVPDDCPLGPEPHEFVPPDAPQRFCCCRQPWEEDGRP